jgi:glycerol-3-phosphate dehydrogenase (NAD(P)+)
MKQVTSIIGCGRWASFLAWYSAYLGHHTLIYGRPHSERLLRLRQTRKNDYLELPDRVEVTDNLELTINHSSYLLIAIGAQNLCDFFQKLSQDTFHSKTLVLCMKGIEAATGARLTQIVRGFVGAQTHVAVWLGPGHVQDFLQKIPNCMVIGSENMDITRALIERYSSPLIRLYIGQDLIGNEIGAAAKNVMGIAAGMLDGLSLSALKGALMARGSREIARLIRAMGGNELTAYGLAHLGDYQATLFSAHSHNRRFGEMFINGQRFEKLAEGVATLDALMQLSEKHAVDMPICHAIHCILNELQEPRSVLRQLLLRPVAHEF